MKITRPAPDLWQLIAAYLAATLTAAIRREEAFLRAAFGDTYDRYRSAEGAFGPKPRVDSARRERSPTASTAP